MEPAHLARPSNSIRETNYMGPKTGNSFNFDDTNAPAPSKVISTFRMY
jgi:hypothetical protein